LGAAFVCAVLGGCVSPSYEPPPVLALPSMDGEDADLREWWREFEDPQLVAVVERVLTHNSDLAAAAARVAEAAALVRGADDLLPEVDLTAAAGRDQTSDRNAFPRFAGIDRRNSFHSIGLDVAWELDLWGRIRAGADAATADLVASAATQQGLRAALAARGAQAYLRLIGVDQRIALSEEALANRREALRVEQRRREAGTATALEVHQAEAEVEAVASTLPLLRAARDNAARALLVLSGSSPADIVDGSVARGAALPQPPAVPEGLPSDLLTRRPDVRAAEASLAAASARVAEARSQYFPQITLTGTLGQESESLADLFVEPSAVWRIAGQLVQPLLGLRKIDARVEGAEARRTQAEAQYVAVVQQAFAEVLDALALRSANTQTLGFQDRYIDALTRTERIADTRHGAGVGSYLDLLDARRRLLDARAARIDFATDELVATIDVYRALGGGWGGDPEGDPEGSGQDSEQATEQAAGQATGTGPLPKE